MSLLLHKPKLQRKTIHYRKLHSIDYEEFNDTIRSSLLFDERCSDLDSLVDSYHSVLKSTLDAYAPEKTRVVVFRPFAPWYCNDIGIQKEARTQMTIYKITCRQTQNVMLSRTT